LQSWESETEFRSTHSREEEVTKGQGAVSPPGGVHLWCDLVHREGAEGGDEEEIESWLLARRELQVTEEKDSEVGKREIKGEFDVGEAEEGEVVDEGRGKRWLQEKRFLWASQMQPADVCVDVEGESVRGKHRLNASCREPPVQASSSV
jgi:hypothetical protein